MVIYTIAALLLGCASGILTGLIPGLHTNTVALIVFTSLGALSKWFSPLDLGVFLIGLVIVHSFLDFIPSLFLGAPDSETALSVLPGHRMLLEGSGYDALKLTIVGGIGSYFFGLLALPLFIMAVKNLNAVLGYVIAPILIVLSAWFVLSERGLPKKVWAILVFLLSGVMGLVVLNNLSVSDALFPMLSGLFGTSSLLLSLIDKTKICEQKLSTHLSILGNGRFSSYIKSVFSASIVSVLPAVGSAQATMIAMGLVKSKQQEDYLVIVGGINTACAIFALSTLFSIGKARTGVLATMKEFLTLGLHEYLVIIAASFVAMSIAVMLALYLGKVFAKNITKINYKLLTMGIIIFVTVLVSVFSGWLGLFVLSIATALGMIAPKVGIKRIHAMGCLVIPVISYFL